MRPLAFINVVLLAIGSVSAQSSLSLEQRNVINDWKAASSGGVAYASDDPKAATIHYQLVRFTGQHYPIILAQPVAWRHGHVEGLIIVDQSLIDLDRNISAFVFAHEWAHLILGHQPNIYRTGDNVWEYHASAAKSEDEADIYAGKFLAVFGYEPDMVYDYLSALPESEDHTHSTGKKRVELVRKGYTSVNVEKTTIQPGLGGASVSDKTHLVKCIHPEHPGGDEVPCTHIAHSGGHRVPCRHPCGAIICHLEGDLEPCTHPVHYWGDRIPCTHLLHPSGDIERIRSN